MLEIADAPVHDLKAVRGGRVRKISAFYQGNRQAAQRRIPRGTDAKNPTTDNDEIVPLFG
jgi:hypothetical protein